MANITYSEKLYTDFSKLIEQFGWFMNMNLMQAQSDLSGEAREQIDELVKIATRDGKVFTELFNLLTSTTVVRERQKLLSKNLQQFVQHCHTFLTYATPRIRAHKPKLMPRIDTLTTHYSEFVQNYLQ